MGPNSIQKETLSSSPPRVEVVDLVEKKCDVTENARQRLESWGITNSSIEELMELSAGYEYNNVEAQAKGIVERGAIVSVTELGSPVIILPNFYDLEGNRRTGQCAEISFKVLRDIVRGGWLNEINAANTAAGRAPIDRHLVQGKPPHHFSQHFWINLHPKGNEDTDGVIVDGPLRKILLQSETDYIPTRVRSTEDVLYLPKHETLRIGRITQDEVGNWKTDGIRQTSLGMTTDYALAVDVGYAINTKDSIQPILYAYDDSNTSIAACTRIDGQRSWRDENNIMDDVRRVELEHIMDILEGMSIDYDESAHKRYEDDDIRDNPQEMDLASMSRVL